MPPEIEPGHYAAKQIHCSSRTIRWTHGARFRTGLELVQKHGSGRLLDYGCGDGTFLAMLAEQEQSLASMVGAEISEALVEDCRRRFAGAPGVTFETVDALRGAEHDGRYDTIVCMEVLEHVTNVDAVLTDFDRLLSPSGRVIISVPVETGLPVLIKQAARRVAGWRGIGDYPGVAPYTYRALFASLTAGARSQLDRPVFADAKGGTFHAHTGFNWMALRRTIASRYRVLETAGSPVRMLPPHLNSQAWFVACRP